MGRRKGGHNNGYFYRPGRGWFVVDAAGKFVALEYENRDRMRDKETPAAELKAAYARYLTKPEATPVDPSSNVTVLQVCTAYLEQVKAEGATATYDGRSRTLFDFCFGLPSRFLGDDKPKPKKRDYIHDGFGKLPISSLKKYHLNKWLQAHPTWKGSKRSHIQAIKRAINFAVESGMISENPIKGYKAPKQNARVTYLTPEQESALCDAARPPMRMAIKVCIRTGARPGCEFAKLTAAHIEDHGERMTWTFKPDESKTKILRIIRVTDPEILAIVRQQIAKHPTGPIFRCAAGTPWTRQNLTEKFRNLKNTLSKDKVVKEKVVRKAITFDKDAVMYSCRHTFAKRVLQGFWSGKATNIETLAKLMGNSPQVCRDHYLQWCDHYSEPLWEAV
jgi:integrase